MSLKHAILGFLQTQSLTGYDLKKTFDQSVQFFWPANQSQIYRTLAQMTEEGLVQHENIEREDLLDIKIYHLTPDGTAELNRWLATPLSLPAYRDASLVQLYFSSGIEDEKIIAVLQKSRDDARQAIELLHKLYQHYLRLLPTYDNPRKLFFNMLTIEYGLVMNQTNLEWLESVISRLEKRQYQPQTFENMN